MQVIRETVNAPGCVTSVFHPPHRPHLHPARPLLPPLTAAESAVLHPSNASPNPVPPHGPYCLHSLLYIESSYYTGLQSPPTPPPHACPPSAHTALTAYTPTLHAQASNACPTPSAPTAPTPHTYPARPLLPPLTAVDRGFLSPMRARGYRPPPTPPPRTALLPPLAAVDGKFLPTAPPLPTPPPHACPNPFCKPPPPTPRRAFTASTHCCR